MAGSVVWLFDGLMRVHLHQWPHAVLAFVLAGMFGLAWVFYSQQQPRR